MRTPPVFALLAVASCATLAGGGGGDSNLPTSGVGPFQALSLSQVHPGDVAPYVLLDPAASYRDPSALAATSDPTSPAVLLYAIASTAQGAVIVRSHAADGVSFYGDSSDDPGDVPVKPPVVLAASEPWEGTSLSGPSALRVQGQIWLYYAAAGGIGLARSTDGLSFTKQGAPVLGPLDGVPWAFTPPRAPSVAVLPDGSWHMMFAAGDAVAEAKSADGVRWTPVDGDPSTAAFDPVLEPSPAVDPSTLPVGVHPPFDEGAVDDPLVLPRVDPAGNLQIRVLYTGWSAPLGATGRVGAVGFAARYGSAGRLSKQALPVYEATTSVAGPAYLEAGPLAMLYVAQDNTTLVSGTTFTAIAGAFAPSTAGVPEAGAYPTGP